MRNNMLLFEETVSVGIYMGNIVQNVLCSLDVSICFQLVQLHPLLIQIKHLKLSLHLVQLSWVRISIVLRLFNATNIYNILGL